MKDSSNTSSEGGQKMKVRCPTCGIEGFVQVRGTNVMVQHYKGFTDGRRIYQYHKIPYGTFELLQSHKDSVTDQVQVNASNSVQVKDFKSASVDQEMGAGRLAWLGHWLYERPNSIDWQGFIVWIEAKYAKSYVHTIKTYTKKYWQLISGNPREFDIMPKTVRNNAIKSLVILGKYLGVHKEFKQRLDEFGIKMYRPDVFASFLRIYNNQVTDIDQ
jgi:hypothetical protein